MKIQILLISLMLLLVSSNQTADLVETLDVDPPKDAALDPSWGNF
jgi:hypothetical protein